MDYNQPNNVFVSLPCELITVIKDLHKTNKHLSIDLCLCLISDIVSITRDLEGDGWVTYNAQISSKNYDIKGYKAADHLKFLVEKSILERLPLVFDKRNGNISRRYRLSNHILNSTKSNTSFQIVNHQLTNDNLIRKILKKRYEDQRRARFHVPYLVDWLTNNITIDKEAAIAFIIKKYTSIELDSKAVNKSIRKKISRLSIVSSFDSQINIFSMNGKDNRLHSLLTRLPSDLKQFVRCNGEKLKEADIKSSQPSILTYIIEQLINIYTGEISKKGKLSKRVFMNKVKLFIQKAVELDNDHSFKRKNDVIIPYEKISEGLFNLFNTIDNNQIRELNNFIDIVRNKDLYQFIGDILLNKGIVKKRGDKFIVTLIKKEGGKRTYEWNEFEGEFDSVRDASKIVVLISMYCSSRESSMMAIKQYRLTFPFVFKLMNIFKVKGQKSIFSSIMQNIESKIVLKYCTGKIVKECANMPIISRHDSLSTTEEYFPLLHKTFQELLSKKMEFNVDVGKEAW